MDESSATLPANTALADAIETLESLQRSYARSGEKLEERANFTKKFVNDLANKMGFGDDFQSKYDAYQRDAESRMFSRYDDPAWFAVASHIVKQIEAIMADMGPFKDHKKIIFGTSATGEINGLAANVNNPEYYVVLIEDGVFAYSNLLAKAIAQMFPVGEESDELKYSTDMTQVQENIRKHPILVGRLVDLVLAYIIAGHPHAAEQYLPDKRYLAFTSLWRNAMETFVLAHEFGHARLGHLRELRSEASAGGSETPTLPPSWQKELQADHFALAVTLSVLAKDGYGVSLTYAGIEAFFMGLELIERTLSLFCGVAYSDQGDATHPSAAMRRAALRIGLEKLVPGEESKNAIALATILERILDLVDPRIAQFVASAKQEGLAPHPKWSGWVASILQARCAEKTA